MPGKKTRLIAMYVASPNANSAAAGVPDIVDGVDDGSKSSLTHFTAFGFLVLDEGF